MALQFAPNLSMLYPEVPFLDRFARAAAAGFTAVEFLFPYEFGQAPIRQRLRDLGLQVVLFNISPGNFAEGERGYCNHPAQRDHFRRTFDQALDYAAELGSPRIHVMIGNTIEGIARAAQLACVVENLTWAAPQAAAAHVTLCVEPLNATDQPRYFVHNSTQGMEIIQAVNQPNVRLQFDFYHMQMSEGNLSNTFTRLQPFIGHVQISDAPGRHQPGTGEINYQTIFALLDRLQYTAPIGLEYRPQGDTDASLDWLPRAWRAG